MLPVVAPVVLVVRAPLPEQYGLLQAVRSPPSFDAGLEAGDTYKDKRPRSTPPLVEVSPEAARSGATPIAPITPIVPPTWAPQLLRGDRPINIGDNASSSETAYGLAQGLLLPADMQKELASALERLVSTGMVNGIKVIFSLSCKFYFYIFSHAHGFQLFSSVYPKDDAPRPKAE